MTTVDTRANPKKGNEMNADQQARIIALANASGIDTDDQGDIFGSTNGALLKFAEALLADSVAEETEKGCTVPPPGWHCIRAAGHEGPCAAIPVHTTSTVSVPMDVHAMLHDVAAKLGMKVTVHTTVGSGDLNRAPMYCLLSEGTQAALEEVRNQALEAEIMARRIAIIPENEGGFQAEEYGDEDTPKAKGYGETPSAAIRALKRTTSTVSAPTCELCSDSGIVGFPPDQYEACPECNDPDTSTDQANADTGSAE